MYNSKGGKKMKTGDIIYFNNLACYTKHTHVLLKLSALQIFGQTDWSLFEFEIDISTDNPC